MRKLTFISTFVLAASFLSGCGRTPTNKGSIDKSTKSVFLSCKQKIDIVKSSISELSMEESGEYEPSRSRVRSNYQYVSLDKSTYLSEQNFGLYVFNDAYYAITNGYDKEKVSLETTIYSEVTNELDEYARLYLKENNKTSKFYMTVNKSEDGYSFVVDWLGDGTKRIGSIYVNGDIKVSGNDVTGVSITAFSENTNYFLYSAYYDFVNNKFYHLNIIDSNSEDTIASMVETIDKINSHTLTVDNLGDYFVAVAKGNITRNINDINFVGYSRNASESSGDSTAFNTCFNEIINKTTLKIRSSNDKIDYSNVKKVSFMDEALQYGLDVTKLYITASGSAVYSYVNRDDFISMCDGVSLEAYRSIFQQAKEKLQKSDNDSVEYNDDEFLITEYHLDQTYMGLNTYQVEEIHYQLTDKVEDVTIYFAVKGDDIVNIKTTDIEYIPSDDPTYEQEVKVLLSLSRDEINAINNVVTNPFNETWKGKYKVSIDKASDQDSVINNIINASEGRGALPNAFLSNADKLEKLVSNSSSSKLIYNFDSFFKMDGINYNEEELEKFDDTLLESGTHYSVSGRYGLPFTSSDVFMVYDTSMFTEYDVPQTFEELISLCRTLKTTMPNLHCPLFIDSETNFLMGLLLQRGISLTDESDKESLISTLTELKGYLDEGLFSTRAIENDYSIRYFNGHQIAMSISGSQVINYLNNSSNVKVAPIPYDNDNQVYSRAHSITSLSLVKTGNPYATRGAWLFIKELLSSYLVSYSLNNYLTPSLKYDLEGQTVTGLKKEVATISNSIRDKYNAELDILNDGSYENVFVQLSQGMSPSAVAENIYNALKLV